MPDPRRSADRQLRSALPRPPPGRVGPVARVALSLVLPLGLAACAAPERPSATAAPAAQAAPAVGDPAATDPADLLKNGLWTVETIEGTPPPDPRVRPTLDFRSGGTLGGSTCCNGYRATWALSGDGLSVGQPVTTRRACPEPLMALERRFLAVLTGASHHTVAPDGTLTVETADGRTLTAVRPGGG
jgi:heat shock protein HslJ